MVCDPAWPTAMPGSACPLPAGGHPALQSRGAIIEYMGELPSKGVQYMGITNSNKVLSQQKMSCRDTVKVTLALTAAPDILTNPTDIALVLDRSGSMQGATLENMKMGAKTFIDIIAESTGGAGSGQIGSGSRIGVVSFSDTAVDNTPLITSTETLKAAVDSLVAAGSTNHADAFATATALFDYSSANARVIVLFTDGKTTSGPPPAPCRSGHSCKGRYHLLHWAARHRRNRCKCT